MDELGECIEVDRLRVRAGRLPAPRSRSGSSGGRRPPSRSRLYGPRAPGSRGRRGTAQANGGIRRARPEPDSLGEEQHLIESSPLVVLDDESRACTVAEREPCSEPPDRSDVDDDLVRGIDATSRGAGSGTRAPRPRPPRPPASPTRAPCTGRDRSRGAPPTFERGRRSARSARRAPPSTRARSPDESRTTRFEVTRKTWTPCVRPAQDRLERVEVRGDQLAQTSGVAFARRTVRADDGSPVLTHA